MRRSKCYLKLGIKLLKCKAWNITLYGSETWALCKAAKNYLESSYMRYCRRREKTTWMDKSAEEVLQSTGKESTILDTYQEEKVNWIWYILSRKSAGNGKKMIFGDKTQMMEHQGLKKEGRIGKSWENDLRIKWRQRLVLEYRELGESAFKPRFITENSLL